MLWSTGICLHWRPFKSIHLYWLNPNMSRQIYQRPLFSEGSERREMRCMWTECPWATLLDYNFVFERQHEIWSDPIYCLKYIPLVFLCLLGLIIYHYSTEQNCFFAQCIVLMVADVNHLVFQPSDMETTIHNPINSQWVKSSLALHCFSNIRYSRKYFSADTNQVQANRENTVILLDFHVLKEKCVLVLY